MAQKSVDRGLAMPYCFKTACSPHLASRLEHRRIDKGKIIKSFKAFSSDFDLVLVEGIGGVLVPFNEDECVIDIAQGLKLPVLVVVENKLGAVNQALLAVEALKKRKMNILGIVFNNIKKEDKRILKDNPRIVKRFTGCDTWQWRKDISLIVKKILKESDGLA
jgi:dethiobiotin synthetase